MLLFYEPHIINLNCLYFVVYDVGGATSDRNVIMMNEIRIDIMDYILPASCNDADFRAMWAEFEWENKVRSYTLTWLFCCL